VPNNSLYTNNVVAFLSTKYVRLFDLENAIERSDYDANVYHTDWNTDYGDREEN
jgi:hypothetical protein